MKSGSGYEYVYVNGKPVLKARVIMSEFLGRPLQSYEVVGYKNGDRSDCRIENLILHLRAGVPLDTLVCGKCGSNAFTIRSQES